MICGTDQANTFSSQKERGYLCLEIQQHRDHCLGQQVWLCQDVKMSSTKTRGLTFSLQRPALQLHPFEFLGLTSQPIMLSLPTLPKCCPI